MFDGNDNFDGNDEHGSGGFGGSKPSLPPEIRAFNASLSRGLTTRIPDNIGEYLKPPTVGEVTDAAMYMAKNSETYSDIASRPGPYSISEEDVMDRYSNASSVITTDAVRAWQAADKKWIAPREVGDHHKVVAESAYMVSLYTKGIVDVEFDEDGKTSYVFTKQGRDDFPKLLIREVSSGSLFTQTLKALAESDEELNDFMEEGRKATLKLLGDLASSNADEGEGVPDSISDFLNSLREDYDKTKESDEDFDSKP